MNPEEQERLSLEYLGITKTSCGYILKEDKNFLVSREQVIRSLIGQSSYYPKINNLLCNLDLAHNSVINLHEELRPPNCLGTVLWITGKGKLNYPYHAYDYEIKKFMKPELKTHYALDTFVFSGAINMDGIDYHGGLCLGVVDKIPIIFAQHGDGRRFGVETIQFFKRPECYNIE